LSRVSDLPDAAMPGALRNDDRKLLIANNNFGIIYGAKAMVYHPAVN
jgi:hypothetical protein